MATFKQIEDLRRAIAEPTNAEPYTDEFLNDTIDEKGSVNHAAAYLWDMKASAAAGMVDVSESGSSRKLGDLYKNAVAMANLYSARANPPVVVPPVTVRRSATRRITRPTA